MTHQHAPHMLPSQHAGLGAGAAPLLTVIVPVFNEQATIGELLRRVVATPWPKQVIVVDDGSTDGTWAALEGFVCADDRDIRADDRDTCADDRDIRADDGGIQRRAEIVLLRHAANRGKGTAIRTALDQARGRFAIVQDADLEYDPGDYGALLEPLLAGEADVVFGSRYLRRSVTGARWTMRAGVMLLNWAVYALHGAWLTDEATCYKLIPTDVLWAMDLRCERFEFCPEVTAKACRMGMRIMEVPVSYHARSAAEGKKIRLADGWEALATLWRWRRWEPAKHGGCANRKAHFFARRRAKRVSS